MSDSKSKLTSSKELLFLNSSFSSVKVDSSGGLLAPSENLLHLGDDSSNESLEKNI